MAPFETICLCADWMCVQCNKASKACYCCLRLCLFNGSLHCCLLSALAQACGPGCCHAWRYVASAKWLHACPQLYAASYQQPSCCVAGRRCAGMWRVLAHAVTAPVCLVRSTVLPPQQLPPQPLVWGLSTRLGLVVCISLFPVPEGVVV